MLERIFEIHAVKRIPVYYEFSQVDIFASVTRPLLKREHGSTVLSLEF
jgi:hypothetical protein